MKNLSIFLFLILLVFACGSQKDDRKKILEIDRLYANEQFEAAREKVNEYLVDHDKSAIGWAMRGNILESMDDDLGAQTSYMKALALDSSNVQSYVGLGILARKSDELDAAEIWYEKALAIDPEYAAALSSISVVKLLKRNFKEAALYGERAFKLDDQDPVIASNLCIAYHYYGNHSRRDLYYKIAKKLNYPRMESLDDIISGETSIFGDEEGEDYIEEEED